MLLMSHHRKSSPRRRRNSSKSYVGTTECQADRGVTTRNPSTPFTGDRAGSQGPSLNEALGRAVFGIDEYDILRTAPRRVNRQEHDRTLDKVGQGVDGAALEEQ